MRNIKGFVKKITSFTLVASMLFSLIPNGKAFAEETITEDSSYSEETTTVTTEEVTTEEVTTEESTTEEPKTEKAMTEETNSEAPSVEKPKSSMQDKDNEEKSEETTKTTESTTKQKTTEKTTEAEKSDKTKADEKDKVKDAAEKSKEENLKESESTDKDVDVDKKEDTFEYIPTFNKLYGDVSIEGIDFSSCELLIATADSSIFTQDTEVVSEYKNVYLTRYPDADQTMYAYTYYYNKCDFIDVNATIKASDKEVKNNSDSSVNTGNNSSSEKDNDTETEEASEDDSDSESDIPNDGHGEADLSDINNSDDALSNVNNIGISDLSGCIALIDSGASTANVVKSVSVLGGETTDDYGHGTKMANAVAEANPEARILSIKALGADGTGTVADVYAAIEYAVNANVSIINLSMSSIASAESDALSQAIADAQSKGIKVVASAGNNGRDASYYTPGNINGVITVGACNMDGDKLSISNYGSTVDYYVVATTTSYAAAKFSAYLLSDGLGKVTEREDVFDKIGKSSKDDSDKSDETNEDEPDCEEQKKALSDLDKLTAAATAPSGYPQSFTANVTIVQTSGSGKSFSGYISDISGSDYDDYIYVSKSGIWCTCHNANHRAGGCADPGPGTHTMTNITFNYTGEDDEGFQCYSAASNVDGQSHINGYQIIGVSTKMWKPSGSYLRFEKLKGTSKLSGVWFALYGKANGRFDRIGYMVSGSKGIADVIYTTLGSKSNKLNDTGCLSNDQTDIYGDNIYYLVELGKYATDVQNEGWKTKHTVVYNPTADLSSLTSENKGSLWEDASLVSGKSYTGINKISTLSYSISCSNNHNYHKITTMSKEDYDDDKMSKVYEGGTTRGCGSGDDILNGTIKYLFVKKIDEEGNPVANIKMQFYAYDSKYTYDASTIKANGGPVESEHCWKLGKTITTDNRGIAVRSIKSPENIVEDLNYFVVEVGYNSSDDNAKKIWNLKDEDGNYVNRYKNKKRAYSSLKDSYEEAYETAMTATASTAIITNKLPSTVKIKKINGCDGNVDLSKMKFDFYRKDGTSVTVSPSYNSSDHTYYYSFDYEEGTTLYFKENKAAASTAGFNTSIKPLVSGATAVNAEKNNVYEDYFSFKTKSNDNKAITINVTDYQSIYVYVKKSTNASYIDYVKDNPNYSLDGTTFEVKKGTTKVGTLVTDKDGNVKQVLNAAGTDVTAKGKMLDVSEYMNANFGSTLFTLVETKAGKGYGKASDTSDTVTKANTKSNPKEIKVSDIPGTDPLNIVLYKEGLSGTPTGAQSLTGAEFTVKFYPQDIDKEFDSSKNAQKTWTFATRYDNKNNVYTVHFDKDHRVGGSSDWFSTDGYLRLPYGYITIQETKKPYGYKDTGSFVAKDATGKVVDTAGTDGILKLKIDTSGIGIGSSVAASFIKVNEDIRADLDITKLDDEGKPIADVQFRVTRVDKGKELQSVILVTDENGFVSTASTYISHKKDTNSESSKSGTWFGELGSDGRVLADKINDKLGALPVGTYKIKELRCAANKGRQLETFDDIVVTESDDKVIFHLYDKNASEADGKVWNYKNPLIHTTARVILDSENQEVNKNNKTLAQSGINGDWTNQTIEDVVTYERLRRDTEYTLLTELMIVDRQGNITPYLNEDGSAKRVISSFRTGTDYKKSKYEISSTQTVNIDGVNPSGLEEQQKKLVVYETLYLGKYTSLENLDKAIAEKTIKTRYDEYNEKDNMDFFPVEHKDPDDDFQTVRPGDIHTTIKDSVSQDRIAKTSVDTKLIDSVYYTGLTVGEEYTVEGTLQIKEGSDWSRITYDPKNPNADKDGYIYTVENDKTNKVYTLRDASGNPVKASKTFIAETSEGYVDLEFIFDSSALQGKSAVAFETLKYKGVEISSHTDIRDEDETIHFPEFKTTTRNILVPVSDITENNKISSKEVSGNQKFIDTIHVTNMIANRTYRFKGTLVNKANGKVVKDAKGKTVSVTKDFTTDSIKAAKIVKTPDAFDYMSSDGVLLDMSSDHANYLYSGDIDIEFGGFDFSNIGEMTGVVYEEIYLVKDGKEISIGEHKDINDIDQFVYFLEIHTNAKDILTDSRVVAYNTETTIEDEVTYKGLIPGKKYTLTATIHVKNDKSGKYNDGDELKQSGKVVTVNHDFIPSKSDGVEKVQIKINTKPLKNMDLVVFEKLTNSFGIKVAVHADINDENQTVHTPEIGTKATVNGKKSITTSGIVTIKDEVTYENLEINKKYTVKGVLMDKKTGKELLIGGKTVTAEKTFEAKEKNGTVELEFTFSTKNFSGDVVVFERMYHKDIEVAAHADIQDEDQTIKIETPPSTPPSKPPVKTGDSLPVILIIVFMFISMAGVFGIVMYKRKSNK